MHFNAMHSQCLPKTVTGIASDALQVQGEGPTTPRLSEGRQVEVVRWRFSIVGACPLGSLVKKPRGRNESPIFV